MGWIHYLAYQRSKNAKVTAIVTRDPKKQQGDWTSIKGNFGPPGTRVDLNGIDVYSTCEEMLQSGQVDAVDICLPPAMHTPVAIQAFDAGKHVLCEKPIALTSADGKQLVDRAKQCKVVFNVAHVLPYMGAFRFALAKAQANEYGPVRSVTLKRIISDPTWISDFYNPKTVGGPIIDLHIHDAHFVQLLCGMPREVTALGWMRDEVVEYAQILYRFESPDLVASASAGVCTSSARMFTHGYEIQFAKAALTYEFAAHSSGADSFGLLLYDSDGTTKKIELPNEDEIDAFRNEIDDFAAAVQGKLTGINLLSASTANNAVEICEAIETSVKRRAAVKIG
jgi:predicted dehydrogenase